MITCMVLITLKPLGFLQRIERSLNASLLLDVYQDFNDVLRCLKKKNLANSIRLKLLKKYHDEPGKSRGHHWLLL